MTPIFANWPAPSNVKALVTTRQSGFSHPPFDSNNFGLHVGDNPIDVLANRKALNATLQLPSEPIWLDQQHTNHCIIVEQDSNRLADAAITCQQNRPLVIMTADCLPILLCNQQGNEIAAIHAGWRGLVNGIIENTLAKMQSPASQLIAWIGPAICSSCFEVGQEVLEAYQKQYSFVSSSFQSKGDKWLANLPELAENVLKLSGVFSVFQSKLCTFEQKNKFFSYRRESQTGRMVSLIWFK